MIACFAVSNGFRAAILQNRPPERRYLLTVQTKTLFVIPKVLATSATVRNGSFFEVQHIILLSLLLLEHGLPLFGKTVVELVLKNLFHTC